MTQRRRISTSRGGSPSGGHARANLAEWERTASSYERRHGTALAREDGRAWGMFRLPERSLRLLGDVAGRRALELGCGAASWSIALARRGARVVGLDFSRARLRQAVVAAGRVRARVDLVRAEAEHIPLRDGEFDLVISDYGATTFTDPRRTIPEVARLLRAGGIFVFAHASPFRSIAEHPVSGKLRRTLVRDYFGLRILRMPKSVEFQLPYSGWIRLFAANGLVVLELVEPRAPRAWQTSYLSVSNQTWARHWPAECIWKLRKIRRPSRARTSDA